MDKKSTKSSALHVNLPEQIDNDLQQVVDSTGLSKSEITRRALIKEINDLSVGED